MLARIETATCAAESALPQWNRLFLLSPANCSGKRASLLFSRRARFDLARCLRAEGAPLGEVFSFLSGLYFRGKLAYANAYARPPESTCGIHVITPNRGLLDAKSPVTLSDLRSFARVAVDERDHRYRRPLQRDARKLADAIGDHCDVILLGSIATTKYLSILSRVFASRLRVPEEFIGLGDMSRGGLMLRCVREQRELNYVPIPHSDQTNRCTLQERAQDKHSPNHPPVGWQ